MDCDKCKELLIDYIEGVLDPAEERAFEEQVKSCPECSLELEQYLEIQRAARLEAAPEPSSEVLSRISEAARKSVSNQKTPFWKKWSYSPILVPTISAAIALSVWFYHGQSGFENVNTVATREVGAAKMSPVENQVASMSDPTEEQEMEQIEALQDKEATLQTAVTEEMEKPPSESRIQPVSPERKEKTANISSGDKLQKKETTEEDKVTFRDSDSTVGSESIDEAQADLKAVHPILPDYRGQLELAQRQQIEGDCSTSIRTNEALLAQTPSAPADIQAASYKSLAECYEMTGNLAKAQASYKSLAELDPSQTDLVDQKLAEMKMDTEYIEPEKADSATEPAN